MKRYLLFAGDTYYPSGGWSDFVKDYDTEEEADADGLSKYGRDHQWYEVVDLETGKSL